LILEMGGNDFWYFQSLPSHGLIPIPSHQGPINIVASVA